MQEERYGNPVGYGMFLLIWQSVFLVLKVGPLPKMPWWCVLSPLWLPATTLLVIGSAIIFVERTDEVIARVRARLAREED